MHKVQIPSILGVLLLLVGVFNGVVLIQNRRFTKAEAANNSAPQNVRVTNISNDSFSVSWTSEPESRGFVVWGKEPEKLRRVVPTDSANASKTHLVSIPDLEPSENYYFVINSEGERYDNSGIPWNVNTGPELSGDVNQGFISGSVTTGLGLPIQNALVFATPIGGSTLSTRTIENGHFIIPLSQARSKDLRNYVALNPKTTIEISVFAPSSQVSYAKIYYESSNAIPPISVGQDYDFTALSPAPQVPVPNAEIILPDNP